MTGWQIAATVVGGWFALSFPLAAVVGTALRRTSAPEQMPRRAAPVAAPEPDRQPDTQLGRSRAARAG